MSDVDRDQQADANTEATDRFLDFLDWLIDGANHRNEADVDTGITAQNDGAGETP